MKAEELRIGNYISYKGMIFQVSAIHDQNSIGLSYNPEYPEWHVDDVLTADCKAIRLSKKWYKKFGFVFGNNNGHYVLLKDKENSDYDDRNVIFIDWFEFKYVHMLQNIYYLFNGSELTPNKTDKK